MDIALIEHAERDVDGRERRDDQKRLARQRLLEDLGSPSNSPRIVGGMPIRFIVASIASVAVLNEPPGGRLNEIVPATRRSWWLTSSGVSLCLNQAMLDNGIIVSTLVLTAEPVDEDAFPVAPIELVA